MDKQYADLVLLKALPEPYVVILSRWLDRNETESRPEPMVEIPLFSLMILAHPSKSDCKEQKDMRLIASDLAFRAAISLLDDFQKIEIYMQERADWLANA